MAPPGRSRGDSLRRLYRRPASAECVHRECCQFTIFYLNRTSGCYQCAVVISMPGLPMSLLVFFVHFNTGNTANIVMWSVCFMYVFLHRCVYMCAHQYGYIIHIDLFIFEFFINLSVSHWWEVWMKDWIKIQSFLVKLLRL